MRSRANCRVTVLRGTETNGFGDLVDSDAAVASGIPALINEQNRRVYLPAEGAVRVVRSYAGMIGAERDIRKGDRLRDERNGRVYLVLEISEQTHSAMTPDYELVLSRTT